MTPEKFDQIVEEQIKECKRLLSVRGKTYARYGDRFSNFNKAAALRNTSPEDALGGIMAKHTVALYDFIDCTVISLGIEDAKADDISSDQWEEKITDLINYLFLLRGLLVDTGRI